MYFIRITYFSLITTIITAFNLNAQNGTLKGVIQMDNGEEVISATLQILNTEYRALSNEYGHFEIQNVPYGSYQLKITSIEIEPKIMGVIIDKEQQKITIKVKQASSVLEETVIVGKTEASEIRDRGFAVSVIEPKNLELQSIQTNDLLDRTAGIRVRQSGGLGSEVSYNLNGLSGNSVKIFIDGVPIRNYGPSFSLNSLPPAMIERIEVYKGVVPVHLSDDALGGAINIIMKKKMTNNFAISYSFGSFNTHQTDFRGNYRHAKSGFTINGSGFINYSDNNYKVWGENVNVQLAPGAANTPIVAKRFHDRYRSQGAKFDLGFTNVKWADRFMIGGTVSNMDRQIQTGQSMKVVYGNRHMESQTFVGNLEYVKRNIFKKLDFSTFISYSQLNRVTVDTVDTHYSWLGRPTYYYNGNNPDIWVLGGGESGRKSFLHDTDRTINTRTNVMYRINKNNTLTFNHMLNTFERASVDPMLPPAENAMREQRSYMKNIAGIAYENLAFKQKLRTTIFGKGYFMTRNASLRTKTGTGPNQVVNLIETNMTTGNYSFGGAISYKVIKQLMILASAERAVRLPEANEIFGIVAENIIANPSLKPERSDNYNLGLEFNPYKEKHNLIVRSNIFIRNTNDLILRYNQGGYDQNLVSGNIGKVFTKGVDAEIIYTYKRWLTFSFNGSIFDAQIHNTTLDPQTGEPVLTNKSRLPNTPFFTMNYNFRIERPSLFMKGDLFIFHYNFMYVHQFLRRGTGIGGAGQTFIPTQLVHDTGVAYTFPKVRVTVSFDVRNLFNAQLFDNFALQKPGRAFFVKLTYTII